MLPPGYLPSAEPKRAGEVKPFEMRPSVSVPGGEVRRAGVLKSFEVRPSSNISGYAAGSAGLIEVLAGTTGRLGSLTNSNRLTRSKANERLYALDSMWINPGKVVRSAGCGCNGKCAPCATAHPGELQSLDDFVSYGPHLPPPPTGGTGSSFDIGGGQAECDRINSEVAQLMSELTHLIRQRDLYERLCVECEVEPRMPLSSCDAIDEEIRQLQGRQRVLGMEQSHYSTDQPAWWEINRELSAINDQLSGPRNSGGGLLDMQRLCPLYMRGGVPMGSPQYLAECRLRCRQFYELVGAVADNLFYVDRALYNYRSQISALNARTGVGCVLSDFGQHRVYFGWR